MTDQNSETKFVLSPEAKLTLSIYPISGTMCDYDWWLARTNNQLSVDSLCCYLTYLPEIHMAGYSGDLSLSELQNHCQKLADGLHNHATDLGLLDLKKQLENSPYQALLEIDETFHYRDINKLAFQTGRDVFQQYKEHSMVHIPSRPNNDDFEKDTIECRVSPQVSGPIQGPSENNCSVLVVDADQGFVCMSYFSPNQGLHRHILNNTSVQPNKKLTSERSESG